MKIAVVLNVFTNTLLVQDTLDAIKTYVSDDVLIVVDGLNWNSWGRDLEVRAHKLEGFVNGCSSPYRNVALALKTSIGLFSDVDWVCYADGDALFMSDEFKKDLQDDCWCMGFDMRRSDEDVQLLKKIYDIKRGFYLLGCCVFYKMEFLKKLDQEINFFEKFLNLTNGFFGGSFPGYIGYDLSEYLYPSLAVNMGGKISQFPATEKYLVRWRTTTVNGMDFSLNAEVEPSEINMNSISIIHPSKNVNSVVRELARSKRRISQL